MSYYFSKTIEAGFGDAVARTKAALSAEGFGVLSEIDVAATMKAKLGADMAPYLILGACNPKLAHDALQVEDKIGLMLPCNVIVQSRGDNHTEVSAIDPVASMLAIDNAALKQAAALVQAKLKAVIERL
jgi:uncharacterized protein (DUF302 family)